MSVEFEGDNSPIQRYQSRTVIGSPVTPSLSNIFVKLGIVKDPKQAYKFMIFLIVACIIAAVLIYYFLVVNIGHAPVPASAIYQY